MPRTAEQVLARPTLRIPVTAVIELKHVNAVIATNALRPFFASTGGQSPVTSLTIGNVGSGSSLLVSGLQDQVAMAIQLIGKCDVPPPPEAQKAEMDRADALERRIAALEKKLKAAESVTGK